MTGIFRQLPRPTLLLAAICLLCASNVQAQDSANDDFRYSGWNAGLGAGYLFFEQDEETKHSLIIEGKLGYDVNDHWTVEGSFGYLPYVDANRFDPPASSPENDRFELEDDTWGLRTAADVLYHFNNPYERQWDPFLALTGGVMYYGDELENDQHFDPFGGFGFGLGYHFTPNWLIRGDYRVLAAGHDSEINHHTLLSLGYRWGKAADVASDAQRGVVDELEKSGQMLKTVYFPFDSSELTPTAQETLRANAAWLEQNPNAGVVLEGHCDERGTNEYNFALGNRRAKSAYDFLRTLGVRGGRMETISYGEERPADPRSTEEAWAKNRRVETVVKE